MKSKTLRKRDVAATMKAELELIDKIINIEERALSLLKALETKAPWPFRKDISNLFINFKEKYDVFTGLRTAIKEEKRELTSEELSKASQNNTEHTKLCKELDETIGKLEAFRAAESQKVYTQVNCLNYYGESTYNAVKYMLSVNASIPSGLRTRWDELGCSLQNSYATFCKAKLYIVTYQVAIPESLEAIVNTEISKANAGMKELLGYTSGGQRTY